MIAIPNMDKPKDCWECFNYNCGHWGTHGYDFAETDCPLIEIDEKYVRFKDITRIFFYHFRTADEKTKAMLDEMFEQIQGAPMIGERRADE